MRRLLVLAMAALSLLACSSSTTHGSKDVADPGASRAQCAAALGESPRGCPDTEPAEAAYGRMKASCGVVDADLDAASPGGPTLTAAAKPKLCTSCECTKAVYAYATLYASCVDEDQANAAFAKNLYAIASSCD